MNWVGALFNFEMISGSKWVLAGKSIVELYFGFVITFEEIIRQKFNNVWHDIYKDGERKGNGLNTSTVQPPTQQQQKQQQQHELLNIQTWMCPKLSPDCGVELSFILVLVALDWSTNTGNCCQDNYCYLFFNKERVSPSCVTTASTTRTAWVWSWLVLSLVNPECLINPPKTSKFSITWQSIRK